MFELSIETSVLDLKKIVESGQIFNYEILDEKHLVFKYKNYFVVVELLVGGYRFSCDETTFYSIWYPYFDLDRDYSFINEQLITIDQRFASMIDRYQGVRILQQDPFEMMISFILSQSKAIPQIRKLIHEVSKKYGQIMGTLYSEITKTSIELFQFPTPQQLLHLTEIDFRALKCGYRAAYLVDAIRFAVDNPMESLKAEASDLLWKQLLSIKGIGNKVASCIMLFGFSRMDVFPIDTWMRKIMKELYFIENEKISDLELEKFGKHLFGQHAGIAQQYLFEYGRMQKSFKKSLNS